MNYHRSLEHTGRGFESHSNHLMGVCEGPTASVYDVEKRGLELEPLGRLARSQSLYRLRYPGSPSINYRIVYLCTSSLKM
jgi:hypothetical protein